MNCGRCCILPKYAGNEFADGIPVWPVYPNANQWIHNGHSVAKMEEEYCSYIIIVENIPMPVIFMAIKNTNVRIMYNKANNGNNA
jgi:hypothetical protein